MEKTKNTFQDGLIMDFSPDNTSATSLTSALNATILTFNGNEMALQNDMGNGRVETAYLPEGYIPVGTCEFGDIIYIASYNPLTNRSLIGCFPSPERNISSEELGGLQLSLSYTDFQITNSSGELTGELKSTAVRKVLVDNRNTNPGDKYIVFSELASENFDKFGELENSKKYIKLSIVSIDETGKITYLDTDTHYYLYDGTNVVYDHFISPKMIQHGTDVDEYRNMLLSGWNIFSSKNPGKLAILAELNTIDTFSCTYKVIVDEVAISDKYKEGAVKYTVYFIPVFDDEEGLKKVYLSRENVNKEVRDKDNNITGYEFKILQNLYKKAESKENPLYVIKINPASDTSQIPNYHSTPFDYFKGPITSPEPEPVKSGENYLAFEVIIPRESGELIKSEDLIYSCDIIPAMPFGKLDHLKVPITIDFNKIGSGEVGLTRWRYYNYGTLCTLQYGLEIYNKPGENTKSVTIDFYDNTGHVARYTLENLDSFSGIHTEYLGLNGENYNYRLNKMVGDEYILHKALEYREFNPETDTAENLSGDNGLYRITKLDNLEVDSEYVLEVKDGKKTIYTNDAGTLYSHLLYAALITVTSSGSSEPKRYWRWLWTNNMYNEYYYQVDDFNNLKFLLDLDVNAIFEAGQTYLWNDITLNNLDNNIDNGCYNTYSANVQHIGLNENSNLNLYTYPGLLNDYGCFNLIATDLDGESQLDKFMLDIYLGKSSISYSNSEYEFSLSKTSITSYDSKYLQLSNITNYDNSVTGLENYKFITRETPINVKNEDGSITEIKDAFNIRYFLESPSSFTLIEDEDGQTINYYHILCALSECYYENELNNKPIKLNLAASIFTKAYVCNTLKYTGECPTYSPIIDNESDLKNLGITSYITDGGKISLRFLTAFGGLCADSDNDFTAAPFIYESGKFTLAILDDNDNNLRSTVLKSYGTNDYVSTVFNNVESYLSQFFIYYPFGHYKRWDWSCIKGNYGVEEINRIYNMGNNWKWYGNKYGYGLYLLSFEADGTEYNADITTKGTFDNLSNCNVAGILCIKHPKGGFVALNNYYIDKVSDNKITQTCNYNDVRFTQYPNLSFPLYLILSRIYTKNKTIPTNSNLIKLSNIVRRSLYTTLLTKDVVIKISPKNDVEIFNIAMSGIDYNGYKEELIKIIRAVNSEDINTDALNLEFSTCAKNTTLTLEVLNKQIEFPDIEDKALLSYNGAIIPCSKILDNLFYIYYNNELTPYYDLEYSFEKNEFMNNLKHVLKLDITDIDYITDSLIQIPPSVKEEACDALASAMFNFYKEGTLNTYFELWSVSKKYTNENEFRNNVIKIFLACFDSGNESFLDKNIGTFDTPLIYILQWKSLYPLFNWNSVIREVYNQDGNNLLEFITSEIMVSRLPSGEILFMDMYFNFEHQTHYKLNMITITPQLGLSEYFEFGNNRLQLNNTENHNYLKISTPHTGLSPQQIINGLLCIMKDVSVDITHRITKDNVG